MFRVTHDMMKRDSVYNLDTHQKRLDDLQNNISTGKKIRLPHEDPVAATHSMHYRTKIEEIKQFMKNIDEGTARLNMAEGAVQNVTEIFHRLEELSVQGSNGTYDKNDRAKIAVEVDELLKEMIQIANSKYKGESLFGGYQVDKIPFEVLTSRPDFADREVITQVKYHGDIGKHNREIEGQEYASVNIAGNSLFWGTNETIMGGTPVLPNFQADKNYKIRIDGKEIRINAGDDITAIKDKINSAKLPLVADVVDKEIGNPNDKRLIIKYTSARQMWMEDIEGGNLLQQLGLKDNNQTPNEISNQASKTGMSVFDIIMKIRNDLWKDNTRDLGGEDLDLLRSGMDNITKNIGEIGARTKRFETVMKRLDSNELDMTAVLAKTENVDFAQAIMDMQMLEYIHRSALATTARIIKPSLMDFLR